jgi:thymidine phosphorylase
MLLGAGRQRLDSAIDPAVGVIVEKKVGDPVSTGERICTLYANDLGLLRRARETVRAAIEISPEPVRALPLILARLPEFG